jgi:hypothetical protein
VSNAKENAVDGMGVGLRKSSRWVHPRSLEHQKCMFATCAGLVQNGFRVVDQRDHINNTPTVRATLLIDISITRESGPPSCCLLL